MSDMVFEFKVNDRFSDAFGKWSRNENEKNGVRTSCPFDTGTACLVDTGVVGRGSTSTVPRRSSVVSMMSSMWFCPGWFTSLLYSGSLAAFPWFLACIDFCFLMLNLQLR